MTRAEQEALEFLREFEISTRNYFLGSGMADCDIPGAVLEAHWQLLHNIMRANLVGSLRKRNLVEVLADYPTA